MLSRTCARRTAIRRRAALAAIRWRASDARRAGGRLPGGARGLAHEGAGALHGAGGDARPGASPHQMREPAPWSGRGCARRAPAGSGSASPSALRMKPVLQVPRMPSVSQPTGPLQRVILLHEHHQHLVGWQRHRRAARGGHHGIGLGAIGDDAGVAHQRDAAVACLDRRFAGADIAAIGAFGGRGGEQQLLVGDARPEVAVPGVCRCRDGRRRRPSPGASRRSCRWRNRRGPACSRRRPHRRRSHPRRRARRES